jgi:hypothetical protein
MKQKFYTLNGNFFKAVLKKNLCALAFVLFAAMLAPKAKAQGLVFKNPTLQSGSAGQVNATYRFPSVMTNVDALVKISGRSSNQVKLESIDLTNTGWDKAWQPQVTFSNGTTPGGISDWWMEFTISFVSASNSTPVNPANFNVTALDIDGNGDKINEWVGLYDHKTYTLENNTALQYSSIWEQVNNISTVVGTKFSGPVTNFQNIDTSATSVMATANYEGKNTFRVRTGGRSTGQSSSADRMYSFWFRTFAYQTPVQIGLPVNLKSFLANLENKKPVLTWISSREENFSHYVLERSTDGINFVEAALVFAQGNSGGDNRYQYSDNAVTNLNKGILYYRLRMVDIDGKYKYSETKLVRLAETGKTISIAAFPNPAINELRVTIPSHWQGQKIRYEVFTVNGQAVRALSRNSAGQTETMDISSLPAGSYIIKVSAEKESATQHFIKSK